MRYVPNNEAEWVAFAIFALLFGAAFGAQIRVGKLYIHLGWLALATAAFFSLLRLVRV